MRWNSSIRLLHIALSISWKTSNCSTDQMNPSIVPPRHAALRQQEEQLHTHSTPLLLRVHRSSASRTCVNIYSQCRCLSDYLNMLEGLEETRIGQAAWLLSRSFCIFSLEMH